MAKQRIIAVDFDGTLTTISMFPRIGPPNKKLINELIRLKNEKSVILILWTVRSDRYLREAVEWCKNYGLEFDKINENWNPMFGSPKIYADVYLDDRALNASDYKKLDKTLWNLT